MLSRWMLLITLLCSSTAWAYKVRCNNDQTICEVDSKRLVKGDKVGIFDSDGYLSAIGEVISIKGQWREVKMSRKFQSVGKDDHLERIEDLDARDPAKHFKIRTGMASKSFGLQAGVMSVNAGSGIMALEAEGFMQFFWKNNAYFVGRGLFCRGSGNATINDEYLKTYSLNFQAMGLTGGMAFNFLSGEMVTLRGEATAGVVNNSVSTDGDVEPKVLAQGRIYPGTGLLINLNLSTLIHFSSWNMIVAGEFIHLQNSADYGISVGYVGAI